MPEWEINLALDRMPVWLARLHGGTEPGEGKKERTITFAQAVAEGIIPASGAMSGSIA